MKRIIIGFITVVMFIFMNQTDVRAAVTVNSEEELIAALANGGDIVLGSDIYVYENLTSEKSCNIDMNGYDIIFAVTEEEDYSYSGSLYFYSTVENVVITDSVGGGSFRDEDREYPGSLSSEAENLEIIGVNVSALYISCGNIVISDCHMENFNCSSAEAIVEFKEGSSSNEYDIYGGTYNFDVSEYLVLGIVSIDNGDGTFTTQYKKIEQTGKTYTIYFDNYLDDLDEYYLCVLDDPKKSAEELSFEIENVMGEDDVTLSYPMEKVDADGKLWSVEIDRAYFNAVFQIEYEAGMVSSMLMMTPDEDGITVDSEGNFYGKDGAEIEDTTVDEGDSETPTETEDESSAETPTETDDDNLDDKNNNWIFIVAGVVVLIVAIVAIIVIVLKKKK